MSEALGRSEGVIIRRAEPQDCDAVFVLAKTFGTSFVLERRAFESSFAALLESPDAFLAVAVDRELVIGFVLGFDHPTFFANGPVSWVEEIMVAEELRRRGVGRRLMERFEQWSRVRGAKLIALATRRAAEFYRHLGYEVVGQRTIAPGVETWGMFRPDHAGP